MVIREEIEIAAPLSIVWNIFSRLKEWDDWNTACQSCHLIEGEEMAAGACFSFVVRPFTLPIKVKPRITECEPGQKVVWEGERLGIHAVHTWTFREIDSRVTLISHEEFSGLLIWLARLILVPQRLHSLTRQLLASVKQEVEARYQAQKVSGPRLLG
ncbi:MAG: SRPBCC family protein [Deltaproteobacteria bacterium]|nr:SRPBCC family protein [Deltaproteobacteria bacterium]